MGYTVSSCLLNMQQVGEELAQSTARVRDSQQAGISGNRSQQRQHKDLPDKEVQRGCGSLSLERPNIMASSSVPALNQELQCSICLEVFTDPVTTPCGHNFCRTCLSKCWTNRKIGFCPFCKEEFSKRLDLKINSTLVKLVQHFNKLNQESKVFCDFCDERKQKAVKSCLTCQSSYCVSHLELHLRVPRLKKHTLINAVENLEDYICQKHERPLEMFCRDDQTCVCLFCTEGEHRTHNTVPIVEESQEKKTQTDEQQMIQKRMKKIQEIKHSVKPRKTLISNDCFLTSSRTVHISNWMVIGLGVLLVAALIILPKQYTRCQSEQLKMKEQQKEAKKQGEDLIKELQQEITELKKKNTELEKRNIEQEKRNIEQEKRNTELEKRNTELEKRNSELSHTDDHLHLIQMYLNTLSHTKDWTEISSVSDVDVNSLKRVLTELKKLLNEKLTELKFVQKFAVDVTLDPDTAHPRLILSDDGKQVSDGGINQNVPENPKRFGAWFCVLAKEGFSSGRFYYEVQVKRKTQWELGVARESINRKENTDKSPVNGYWTVTQWTENNYAAYDSKFVSLSLRVKPEKVGVFVDYEEGLVSFYDVDSRSHIYSFTGQTFTEKLYPYFSPYLIDKAKNSNPLIITPVS
ncbi:E3 ubiquitin-protein ligase TRIM39-like isoform X5 [Chanodichthys erythropterus]|uniref:E3 ubiquitin-protein ligase TRIM39-like isoform X5 n=1 Tax=Chanodichthys erythropterus TaxID=933992 RepID=UPI00351EF15C